MTNVNVRLGLGFVVFLLAVMAAGCASAPKGEAPHIDVYMKKNVWMGDVGNYNVAVSIRREGTDKHGRCSQRIVEIKPSAGLHRRAWGYVRAYDYDCDGWFNRLSFRYPRDRQRASIRRERDRLKADLWFAFGSVVPVEEQMP